MNRCAIKDEMAAGTCAGDERGSGVRAVARGGILRRRRRIGWSRMPGVRPATLDKETAMNRAVIARFLALSGMYLLGATPLPATAQTSAPGAAMVSQRLASDFATFAGSEGNAASLVNGLRSGAPITLVPPPATAGGMVRFTPPTRPMGWGNVRHALTLAQRDLAAQGIVQPTPDQLQAALTGGAVVAAPDRIRTLPGVLTLRSQGMGWGKIARRLDVPMGDAASIDSAGHGHAHRAGTAAGTNGTLLRSAHWSADGSSHAHIGAGGHGGHR